MFNLNLPASMLVREMEEVLVERWVELRFYHIKKREGEEKKGVNQN